MRTDRGHTETLTPSVFPGAVCAAESLEPSHENSVYRWGGSLSWSHGRHVLSCGPPPPLPHPRPRQEEPRREAEEEDEEKEEGGIM